MYNFPAKSPSARCKNGTVNQEIKTWKWRPIRVSDTTKQYDENNRKKENLKKKHFSQEHNFLKIRVKWKKEANVLPVPISPVKYKIRDREQALGIQNLIDSAFSPT